MQMVVIMVVRKSVMGLLFKSVTDCAVSKAFLVMLAYVHSPARIPLHARRV
jgi:hypothetical protein